MAKELTLDLKVKIYGLGLALLMAKVHFLVFRDHEKAMKFSHNFAVLRMQVGGKNYYKWLRLATKLEA